jgi:hypothetical protein
MPALLKLSGYNRNFVTCVLGHDMLGSAVLFLKLCVRLFHCENSVAISRGFMEEFTNVFSIEMKWALGGRSKFFHCIITSDSFEPVCLLG